MKKSSMLTVMLILQLSLSVLAKEKDEKKELYNSNSKLMVTPSKAMTGDSKVMVTPRDPVPNRTQLPANFNSMKDARRQERRYRRQSVRRHDLQEIRPACSHELNDPDYHEGHYCSEMATWENDYRARYGHTYREPETMTPYPVTTNKTFFSEPNPRK